MGYLKLYGFPYWKFPHPLAHGNRERIDKTEMTGNVSRIFLDPISQQLRLTKNTRSWKRAISQSGDLPATLDVRPGVG